MKKILTPREILTVYKEMSAELLPEAEYPKIVSGRETAKELALLRDTIEGERFMFVMNLHKMTIEHASGIERWLGYKDANFSLLDYLNIIHPAHAAIHRLTSVNGIN